tara:strand:- start:928 stop:1086 length:159 start_codon:yes stop_codon:yes gene_type:complete
MTLIPERLYNILFSELEALVPTTKLAPASGPDILAVTSTKPFSNAESRNSRY